MRPIILTALLLTLVAAASAAAQEFSPMPGPVSARQPNFGICAAETGGGFLLGGLGVALGYTAAVFYAGVDESRVPAAMAIMYSAAPALGALGSAGGVSLAGYAFGQDGQFLPALAWAAGVSAAAVGLHLGGYEVRDAGGTDRLFRLGVAMEWTGVGLFIATPIAATLGYNLSRPRDSYGGRFLPGSVALGSVRDADGVAHPSLDLRLISVRL